MSFDVKQARAATDPPPGKDWNKKDWIRALKIQVFAACGRIEYLEQAAAALMERLKAAEAVCEAAESVASEDAFKDEALPCYVMGIELLHRLEAWRRLKVAP